MVVTTVVFCCGEGTINALILEYFSEDILQERLFFGVSVSEKHINYLN